MSNPAHPDAGHATGIIVDDGQVGLRPLSPADAEAHQAGTDAELVRWLGDGRRATLEMDRQWLGRQADAWAARADVVDLGVLDLASGELVGTVGVQRGLDYLAEGEVNLSYCVYPAWRGRGIAGRAVRLAQRLAAAQGPVSHVWLRIAPDNTSSQAVARKLGGVLVRHTNDEHGDLDWYDIPG